MRVTVRELLHSSPRVLIIGLGYRTGLTSANFLASSGADVTVSDMKDAASLSHICSQLDSRVKTVLGSQEPSLLDANFDLIVLSPGVPQTIPLLKEAQKREVPVIAEVELAWLCMKGAWIGITGTDGKSTTTAMTEYLLQKLGLDARAGGNIGIPLVSLLDWSSEKSVVVAELSSYQLETIDTFSPDVAAFLNLAPDHLDRYGSMEAYCDAKMRIVKNMTPGQTFVYNKDDRHIAKRLSEVHCDMRSFSMTDDSADCYFDGSNIVMKLKGEVSLIPVDAMLLPGKHNIMNAMASLLMIDAYMAKQDISYSIDTAAKALYEFPGLEHRLEHVDTICGVRIINDSKATTVNSVKTAADSMQQPTVYIIGGRKKNEDYSVLAGHIEKNAKAVILIGESTAEFQEVFERFNPHTAQTMDEAVRKGFNLCVQGDALLLSTGCASFDMYTDFEERGRDFKKSVDRLKKEAAIGS